jgi:hypothetical protein
MRNEQAIGRAVIVRRSADGSWRVFPEHPERGKIVNRGFGVAGCNPLVLRFEKQDATPVTDTARPGYGGACSKTAFKRQNAAFVKEAGAALENEFGKRCIFGTGTFPHGTKEQTEAFARYSGLVIERLTQWIRDTASNGMYIWVWERHRSGALHLHFAIAVKNVMLLRELERNFARYWESLLKDVSERAGVDLLLMRNGRHANAMDGSLKVQLVPVKKSVAGYLSKYMSKGATAERECESGYPLRWWGISKRLRPIILSMRWVMRTARMAPGVASAMFERIGGVIASAAKKAFSYQNRVHTWHFTLCARLPPGAEVDIKTAICKIMADAVRGNAVIGVPCV